MSLWIVDNNEPINGMQIIRTGGGGSGSSSDAINVLSHGAVADGVYGGSNTDNLGPFNQAKEQALTDKKALYIPPATLKYEFSDLWTIGVNERIEVFGMGEASQLVFPNSAGIKLLSQRSRLHDFSIKGSYGEQSDAINVPAEYGIWMAAPQNTIERLDILNFSGSGIVIQGDVESGTNANLNDVLFCNSLLNGQHGLLAQSGDSNGGEIIGGRFDGNAMTGFKIDTFLGLTAIGFHLDGNGTEHTLNQSAISHGGNRYYCIKDHTGHAGKEPGVSANWQEFWRLRSAGGVGQGYNAWAVPNVYFASAALYVRGGGNRPTLDGYAEGNQNLIIIDTSNGNPGAKITGQIARDGLMPNCVAIVDGFLQTLAISYGTAPPTFGAYKSGYRCINIGGGSIDHWECTATAVFEQATTWEPRYKQTAAP